MRRPQTAPPKSLEWLSKQNSSTPAAMSLEECLNVQQLRLDSKHMLSRSPDSLPKQTHASWWTGILDAVNTIDNRLQSAAGFEERWKIHTTSLLTPNGKPTALEYYQDIQVAKV